jgi:hypothetical protein
VVDRSKEATSSVSVCVFVWILFNAGKVKRLLFKLWRLFSWYFCLFCL